MFYLCLLPTKAERRKGMAIANCKVEIRGWFYGGGGGGGFIPNHLLPYIYVGIYARSYMQFYLVRHSFLLKLIITSST